MPGPPPKHPSVRQRRNDVKKDFRVLTGREGEAPPWPLRPDVQQTATLELMQDRVARLQVEIEETTDGRKRGRLKRELDKLEPAALILKLQIEQAVDEEKELWTELWSFPQAQLWEENRSHREVAQYVRWKVRAEQGDLAAGKEARMLSDRLGLNDLALLRLRAEVEHVDKAEDEGERRRERKAPAKSQGKKKPDDPRGFLSAVN
jgi:hypothetical protein